MARFLLHHRHEAEDCDVVFASFRGHESSLRHREALATCARATAIRVREVRIP